MVLPLLRGPAGQFRFRVLSHGDRNDQGGRLETVVSTFTAHVAVGQAVELRIDDRRQLTKGELVAVAPGAEELTDVVQSDPP